MTSVLFVSSTLGGGGAERVFATLLTHLDRRRFRPALALVRKSGGYLADVPADVPVHDLGCKTHHTAPPKLVALIRRLRPDAVLCTHSHVNLILGMLAPFLPRETRLIGRETAILSRHTRQFSHPALHDAAYRLGYKGLDRMVCQSADMLADLRDNYGLPPAKMVMLPNPVDTDRVVRDADAAANPYPPGGVELVSVGRLAPQKGFDLLLAAVAAMRTPGVRLTVLGEGGERAALLAQAASLGIADAVRFPGFQANPYPYMRHADLFVLASRYEPFPNAVLEALALGAPVAAFRCPGGIAEIVEEGRDGLTAPAGDVAALARAMDDALAARLSREAIRGRARERFDVSVVVPQYERVLAGDA
ncbi:glycosyltransferase [Solidesulfovibrio alcoholivorans]|uniref:glycosyltransferase n=1 Tax=Solidesulfovibrio alcoholivorans TaxID=81406 RepID=UPI000693D4B0|nr:glycosyltransferase [Solidesulfovibrio alcoholivorans]